jgi:hypothetical protein
MDAQGKVTNFSLSEELSEKLKEAKTRELKGFFGDLFTPNGLRHRLTNWLVEFPAEELSSGTKWNQEVPSRAGAKIVGIRNYELIGSMRQDADTFLQIYLSPQFKTSGDSRSKVVDQNGVGWVYLDPETHKVTEYVLQHQGVTKSFAEHSFDIEYSAKLRSPTPEGEHTDEP